MKNIPLTQGKVALISDEDYERVAEFKWCYDAHNHCAVRGIKKDGQSKIILMHRFIMDTPKGKVTDHINSDRLDNRRENLRICDQAQNQGNMRAHRDNTSGYKGVYKSANGWYTKLANRYIGSFSTKIEAAKAYNAAALNQYGDYAKLNTLEY